MGTKFAGPTYFNEFLIKVKNEIIENISSEGLYQNKIYSVLIIISDGNCHDMDMTKKLLVELS